MLSKKMDIWATITFSLLTFGFILLMALNKGFFDWAFARHHNILSWYIRPLIILPLCFFSFKRSALGISMTIFLGLTSMFWFPEPSVVDEQVSSFLDMEKTYLTTGWTPGKVMISMVVPLSLSMLCLAFWKRSIKVGLGIILAIAVSKALWSVLEGGEAGMAVILPAVVGLVVCVGIIYYVVRRKRSLED